MAEVSANCGEQAADIGRNALSHVKKITETTGLPKCSRFLEVPKEVYDFGREIRRTKKKT